MPDLHLGDGRVAHIMHASDDLSLYGYGEVHVR